MAVAIVVDTETPKHVQKRLSIPHFLSTKSASSAYR